MNSEECLDEFLISLKSKSRKGIRQKELILRRFYAYLERTQNLKDVSWDFQRVKKIIFKEKVYYIPLDSTLIESFLSETSPSLKDSMYNSYVTTLNQFGHYLLKRKVLLENPAQGIEHRKSNKNDMTEYRLTLEESVKLLYAAYSFDEHRNRNFALVLILLTTAVRIGEAKDLTEDDIAFDNEIIYANGKSGKRTRIIFPGLAESLKELLSDSLRAKALQDSEKSYVFYSNKGGPLSTKEANKLIKQFAQKAGIEKKITTYWLRRTFATILARSGFNLTEIKNIFHHDRYSSTEGYLLGTAEQDIRELVEESPVMGMLQRFMRKQIELTPEK